MEIPSDFESSSPLPDVPKIRLQRFLASCGLGSRRACEEYITQGRVTVDGAVVTELGTTVNPSGQKILLDGEKLRMERKKYYLFNKPTGVLCTNSDPKRRPRVIDYFPDAGPRLFTVGRLDEDSEGLLLVTNDGDLAQRMAHPRYRIYRTYSVQVAGFPTRDIFDQMKKGIYFHEGRFKVLDVRPVRRQGQSMWLEVVLSEGHNREIRRLFARMGHKVMRLERIAFGPLTLGKLKAGEFRELRHEELERLHAVLEKAQAESRPRKAAGKKRPARPTSASRPLRENRQERGSSPREDGLIEEGPLEFEYGAQDRFPDFDAPSSHHPALPSRPRPRPTRSDDEGERPAARARAPRDRAPRDRSAEGRGAGPGPAKRLGRPRGERFSEDRAGGPRKRVGAPRPGAPRGERFAEDRPAESRSRFERAPGKRPPRDRGGDGAAGGRPPRTERFSTEERSEAGPAKSAARTPRPRRPQEGGGSGPRKFSAADRRFPNRQSSGEAKRRTPARKKKPRRGEGRS